MRQKENEKTIIYYENELEDEFSTAQITPRKIDGNYNYEGGVFRKIGRVFWYHIIAKPLAYLFLKIKFQHKIVNKECLKQAKKTGFFLCILHNASFSTVGFHSSLPQVDR